VSGGGDPLKGGFLRGPKRGDVTLTEAEAAAAKIKIKVSAVENDAEVVECRLYGRNAACFCSVSSVEMTQSACALATNASAEPQHWCKAAAKTVYDVQCLCACRRSQGSRASSRSTTCERERAASADERRASNEPALIAARCQALPLQQLRRITVARKCSETTSTRCLQSSLPFQQPLGRNSLCTFAASDFSPCQCCIYTPDPRPC
jgi:hypothetical protein